MGILNVGTTHCFHDIFGNICTSGNKYVYKIVFQKPIDIDKIIERETFKGIGIADCASSWKPDFAIRMIGGAKAEKFETTVLFDYNAELRKSWGLKEDSYNIIILDEERICRALYKGRVPDSEVDDIIQLIVDLQKN